MGMQENAEHGALIHSSIALLQERFRELQRLREMREKRELMRIFSTYSSSAAAAAAPRCFFHHDLLYPSRSRVHGEGSEFQSMEKTLSMSLWREERATKNFCIDAEIDTSLHL